MNRSSIAAALGATALVLAGLGGVSPAQARSAGAGDQGALHPARTCHAVLSKGEANCHALVLVRSDGTHPLSVNPPATGLTPVQLRDAYKLPLTTSGLGTVAIVDAYGYPNLEKDLATYRSKWGLPACTRANLCLRIMDQNGGTNLPRMDLGWAQEQALDVDAVSAACPNCKILVVQAASNSFTNLGKAVNAAAGVAGVVAISNSYGGGDAPDSTYGSYYNHPGIAVTASTGDRGYQGGSYPASSSYTTAVGGTSLFADASSLRGWSESTWSGSGSGCSAYNSALDAAAGFDTGCGNRAMADVSAAADPNNGGLAVYYPTSSKRSTWGQFGGTSESAPIIAAVYALSGNTGSSSVYANAIPYAHPGDLFDVTSGGNGSCPTSQWCGARPGWDGPTGLGTPNGVGGF